MGTFWVVVIDIVIAIIIFLFGSSGFWMLVNHYKFFVPFSNTMGEQGVFDKRTGKQLIMVDKISCIITVAFVYGIALLGAFIARPSGFIVFGASIILSFIFFKPSRDRYTWSSYNIREYVKKHSNRMDMEKFNTLDIELFK